MTIFSEFGFRKSRLPLAGLVNADLVNAKTFALEQLVSVHSGTTDLRWALLELAWRSCTAMWALAQGQFASWARAHSSPREEGGRGRHCCC
jgi:hypothetical protein